MLLRGGDQNLLPTMSRSLSVPDSGPLWDLHTSASSQSGEGQPAPCHILVPLPQVPACHTQALLPICGWFRWARACAAAFPPAGGEASLWDIPINSSTQGPILEQLQLQHKVSSRLACRRLAEAGAATQLTSSLSLQFQERREVELRAKREEEERKRREEKRRQQQQEEQKRRQEEEELFRRKQVQVPPVSWACLGLVPASHQHPLCPHIGSAAGAAAEAATTAAGNECLRAPCTELPAPTLGWPGQAGPVHEDSAGAADGK